MWKASSTWQVLHSCVHSLIHWKIVKCVPVPCSSWDCLDWGPCPQRAHDLVRRQISLKEICRHHGRRRAKRREPGLLMVAQRWLWLALSSMVERVKEGFKRREFELDEELFPQWLFVDGDQCRKSLICQANGWRGFSGSSVVIESSFQCKRHGFNPWIKKIPWRRK